MDAAHVRQGLTLTHDCVNLVNRGCLGPLHLPPRGVGRDPDEEFPRAGSCACYEREETADGEGAAALRRCSWCRLPRYCSVRCQKWGWERHNAVCGLVYSVNFEKWV
ncbi:hypothetical protein BD413DRAFT_573346 [Trametes elegans]|nr:hypothetical protein BD413DRAFT_573346 [Trametes elegans]